MPELALDWYSSSSGCILGRVLWRYRTATLAAVEAERASFLAGLSEAEFERAVSYRTLAGQPYSDALGGLIRHVVNHSTYHRGQVATQLRQLGHTPPNTDLITYLRQA